MSRLLSGPPVKKILVDLAATNVTTSAWLEIVSAMDAPVSAISIFNGSGSVLKISLGAAGDEANQEIKYYIVPGSNDFLLPIQIAKNKRISLKSADVTADVGSFVINCFG